MVYTSPSGVPPNEQGQEPYAVDANMWAPTYVDLPPVICPTIPRVEPDLYTVGTDDLLNLSLDDHPGRLTVNAIVWLNISDESESKSAQLHVVAEGGRDIPIAPDPDSKSVPSSACRRLSFDSKTSIHSVSIFAGETPLDDSKPTRNVPFFLAVMSAEVTASPATVSANVTHVGSASSASSSLTQSQSSGPIPASGASNSIPIASTTNSSNLNIVLPAVLVPLLVLLLGALGAYWWWRRSRRARMAPSAAFRAENPSMASGHPWVPIDEKRALIWE